MSSRKLGKTPPEPLVVTNVKEMKDDAKEFGENKRRLSDQRKFEKGSLTSADKVSIHTGENIKKEGDSHSMRAESKIGKDGGTLEIPNTGVSLKIPPGALRRDYFIRMRIISHHYLDETELSFASNSSVVVELLPNNVKLLIPATLTLPHCLVLKGKCGWKAKVYSSHHKQGNQPQWEEEINTQCDVSNETCAMQLYNFSWRKVRLGDDIVEAKRIILYAAMRPSIENEIFLDIGYYWQLPSCREFPKLNSVIVLHRIPDVFYRDGQLPLKVLLEKVVPTNWTYNKENNEKEIRFSTVAITNGSFCTFVLKKCVSGETDRCACYFKAGQGSRLVELQFSLKESSLSSTEAIIPSTGNATSRDIHEERPSAIAQTEGSAVSEESLLVTV
ncbi:netrin receptor UNC5B-like [Apostichopus japonicus]|uniref:netrin receptor UNC5B-like n=1 Tax=Stichopus japonicus TaxID=307972 RepID=UPI003AB27D64